MPIADGHRRRARDERDSNQGTHWSPRRLSEHRRLDSGAARRAAAGLAGRSSSARTKALMNLPSTSRASASASRPVAGEERPRVFERCRPASARSRSARSPPSSAWRRYSSSSSAPATQPTHSSMLRSHSAGTSPRTTTSETAKRPPGLSTRKASRKHAVLVGRQVDHAVRDDDVDGVVGQRNVLDLAFQKLDVGQRRPSAGSRAASASISSVMSRP